MSGRRIEVSTGNTVEIMAGRAGLEGILEVPPGARGIVLFAHGSGSGRFSPRNTFVAGILQQAGLGTLLLDLLTPAEAREDERTAALRFDIPLLGGRVSQATDWLTEQVRELPVRIGYFGASTGAAAALVAAAERDDVAAVVSRGGRPDLAGEALEKVQAPTLLIVGGLDRHVLELNRQAQQRLRCPNELRIIPGAGHLFEELGTLNEVAKLAADWFNRHMAAG